MPGTVRGGVRAEFSDFHQYRRFVGFRCGLLLHDGLLFTTFSATTRQRISRRSPVVRKTAGIPVPANAAPRAGYAPGGLQGAPRVGSRGRYRRAFG